MALPANVTCLQLLGRRCGDSVVQTRNLLTISTTPIRYGFPGQTAAREPKQQRQIEGPVAPANPVSAKAKVKRDNLQESRDKWIYTQAKKGDKTYRKIMLELAKLALEKGWRKLGSPQAVEQAADRYVVRHNLTPLPPRMER